MFYNSHFLYFYTKIMKKQTMWKENLYQPIEILQREHDDFPIGEHQHSFFEMAYIMKGSGHFSARIINHEKECYTYHENNLFLIPPDRIHLFTIDSHSQYIFIRFTRNYISSYIGYHIEKCLDIQSKFLLSLSDSDAKTLYNLMNMIAQENMFRHNLSELLLQYYVNCIILLCARNLSETASEYDNTDSNKAQYMLQYIQQHIHQPELLRLNILADKFHLSPTYVGRFFKRNFGEDFRQYVSMNRLRMVEDMLVNTKMSIKEIAARMGYIDSCYLNKLFIQHHHLTPVQFRKKYTATKRIL